MTRLPRELEREWRMANLSPEDRKQAALEALDSIVRKLASVPPNRYYSVLHRKDGLYAMVDTSRTRTVERPKISKSDAQP